MPSSTAKWRYINRSIPTSARAHEWVIDDFLARLYESELARRGPRELVASTAAALAARASNHATTSASAGTTMKYQRDIPHVIPSGTAELRRSHSTKLEHPTTPPRR